jgi:hypothetical protein
MNSPRTLVAAALCLAPLVPLLASGCSTSTQDSGVAAPNLPKGAGLEHESCDESGNRVEMLDTNNDGKTDIRRVFNKGTGREVCRVSDLNHDGHPDLYEYFDDNGAVRRRELCFDDTGEVNAIEHYEGGRLAKREYDTGGTHRIDTWDFFEPGLPMDPKTGRPVHPSRRERATRGDGHVDQWWTWDGAKITISRDTSGDGKPDPSSVLVLDANGGADTADAGGASAPSPAPSGSGAPPSVPVASGTPASADAGTGSPPPSPASSASSPKGGKP